MSRVLLLNLPHPERVQRRLSASYRAPNFLIPPLELMALGGLLRTAGHPVHLVDAIAEELDAAGVIQRSRGFRPDLVVALAGFDTLDQDLDALGRVRDGLRGARSVIFGYLPTLRPQSTAAHRGVDVVVVGEPELTVGELAEEREWEQVDGLAWGVGDGFRQTGNRARIRDLDALPFADHSLVDLRRYNEAFVPGPIGVLLSARGCPHPCSWCVKPYGAEVTLRSAASLLDEIGALEAAGIRDLRFLDDTFTLRRSRVLELCEGLRARGSRVRWSCLTRLDRVDPQLAQAMAAAGCRRIYAGIESADPRRLAEWNKGETLEDIEAGARAIKAAGIELSGFFVVGAPGETAADVRRSVALARRLDLDFVIATRLQLWPGTPLHARIHGGDREAGDGRVPGAPEDFELERLFYRSFYLHPRAATRHVRRALTSPRDVGRGLRELVRYVLRAPHHDFI